jgi:hypothetical protein
MSPDRFVPPFLAPAVSKWARNAVRPAAQRSSEPAISGIRQLGEAADDLDREFPAEDPAES